MWWKSSWKRSRWDGLFWSLTSFWPSSVCFLKALSSVWIYILVYNTVWNTSPLTWTHLKQTHSIGHFVSKSESRVDLFSKWTTNESDWSQPGVKGWWKVSSICFISVIASVQARGHRRRFVKVILCASPSNKPITSVKQKAADRKKTSSYILYRTFNVKMPPSCDSRQCFICSGRWLDRKMTEILRLAEGCWLARCRNWSKSHPADV